MHQLRILPVLLVLSFCEVALAGPIEDAVAAYHRRDFALALQLLRPPADQGDATAQHFIGAMYDLGEGTPQDYVAAASWYRKAAEQRHARAQYLLGGMYAAGRGVPRNDVQAFMWCDLAAQNTADAALLELITGLSRKLSGRMSAAQLAEARRLAAAWTPKADRRN